MRDPMSWAIPLFFRPFGITVKVHVFFFIVTLGLFLRQVWQDGNVVAWGDVLCFTVFLLFGIILLHEFGHCFGGRAVGGEATDILIWPLGGLAMVDVPHNWRAHTITVAAGPAVNAVLCIIFTAILAGAGFLPNANPFSNPYVSEMKNYRDGRLYTSNYGVRLYQTGTAEPVATPGEVSAKLGKSAELTEAVVKTSYDRALAPTWVVWINRAFWLSWVLLLFNLIPAYPLDGGQLLQGFIWARTDFRQGITVAAYGGYFASAAFLIASIAFNEALLMGLALFMFYSSWTRLQTIDMEEGPYGDFSAGYTSLEQDDPPPHRPKRVGFVKRWLQARTTKRLQKEFAQRQMEDERMDQLLDKIAKLGKATLTDEERRFMERVSARYRNRS